MGRPKPIIAIDCETDPFLHGRKPEPFLWGMYDGKEFRSFDRTEDFVASVVNHRVILYAHNGGKFDFIYLLPFVRETKAQIINGRIISMFLGKAELRDSYAIIPVALKELGGKKEIDYGKLERNIRHRHMPEIRDYLYHDCKALFDAVSAYRGAAGKHKTIASNALAFCKRQGTDPGKTNHRFDCNYRPFYFGGRTECFKPGEHRNIKIIDLKSAYPYGMMHDHATGVDFKRRGDDFGNLTREQIQRSFISLECTSKGAFPLRTKGAMGLIFPHEYNVYHVTGWEYIAAQDLGLLSDVKIQSVRYTDETINFRDYVEHWYRYKSSHDKKTDPIGYTIGKIMMNSLYGKLAQNPARYYDYIIVEAGTAVNREEGWTLEHEYDNHEIHRRESLWKYKFQYGVEWKAQKIYKNVATGASITGFTRAHLLKAMHSIGSASVIYCDTDSIFATAEADLSRIAVSERIGDWEIEEHNALQGFFAGKKLYAVKLSSGKDKIASKGVRLNFEEVKRISQGETIRYLADAPTFSLDGRDRYMDRSIRSTAKAAPQML